jgi:filamentous hemagglutinin
VSAGVSMATAALAAGMTTLSSQAAVSLINNKGDIGQTLNDMGKSENVRNVIAAMITAGVTGSYGSTHNMESLVAKTAAGCVTGDMTGSGCEKGATTAAILEGSAWANHAMRTAMINDSKTFKGVTDTNDPSGKPYNNVSGQGSVDGDGQRVAGTRISIKALKELGTMTEVDPTDPNTLWIFKGTAIDPKTKAIYTLSGALAEQGGLTGGTQALLPTFNNWAVKPGSFLDKLDESFSGPHDYMGGRIQGAMTVWEIGG